MTRLPLPSKRATEEDRRRREEASFAERKRATSYRYQSAPKHPGMVERIIKWLFG
jgi:hypothetical protein